jgi:arylsulfatase A-like enzyme/Tfp pilus assembly protein PilF
MKRAWIVVAVAAAALAGVAFWRAAARQPFNVLLVTLDTTRADRLGCYGYEPAETPALDRLAKAGLRFTQACTHVPLTLPSHATIMTGMLPPEHGLHVNGRGRLAASVPTLADALRRRGYRTAAFLGSFSLDRRFGLDRGFDVYDDRMQPPAAAENLFGMENPANVVCDRALAWLDRNRGERFFCWVHLFDPHMPYAPPEPYRSRHRLPYDGEVAFMDSQIGRLLDFLNRQELTRRTLVVVCGDHGESFGEHRENGHGQFVYNATMRVPLLVSLPGRVPEGRASDAVAGLQDVAPTIAGALGWKFPEPARGRSLLAAAPEKAACYGECEDLFVNYGWAPLHSLTARGWKYIQCPAPELYDLENDPNETKDLSASHRAVAAEMAGRLAEIRAALKPVQASPATLDARAVATLRSLGYLAGRPAPTAVGDPMKLKDPKAMTEVFDACYKAEGLLKEKRFMETIALLAPLVERSPETPPLHEHLAESYFGLRQFTHARAHVEAALALTPGHRRLAANLVTILIEEGKPEQAAPLLEEILRLPPEADEPVTETGAPTFALGARSSLAAAFVRAGKLDEAIRQSGLALKADPDSLAARAALGDALVRSGRRKEAGENYHAIGVIRARLGRTDQAMEAYRMAIEADPDADFSRNNLGLLLCAGKQFAEAIALWREGMKRQPASSLLAYDLAWYLATCPDPGLRDGREALDLARLAHRADKEDNPKVLDALAAAYAEAGQFEMAAEMAALAVKRAEQTGQAGLAGVIRKRLALYAASRPYHQE